MKRIYTLDEEGFQASIEDARTPFPDAFVVLVAEAARECPWVPKGGSPSSLRDFFSFLQCKADGSLAAPGTAMRGGSLKSFFRSSGR